ncbi:hypothetical protein Lalb_Chr17g0342271 [Lupinus albus]|uniref:Uncharacterized protein n=1 Tax=Lupinus albus TaxID=3870 RepID=A0A6A4P2U2_LUPAL|nr:hypothetical protein Lalb_Chr17g0342271 [Lupinus albus]
MMRTRLVWFSGGLTSTAAIVCHLVWKDLWVDRHNIASDMKNNFDDLNARVSNLESSLPNPNLFSDSDKVEG